MAINRTLALVHETELARAVGERVMARLMKGSVAQLLPPRAVLFEEGTEPEMVHLVLSGRVGLVASGGTDHEAVIETFGAGSLLVVPAVILSLPYLVSGVVLTEARIMMIPAASFRRALDDEPALARAVVDMQARHWRLLIEQIKDLKLRAAPQRLAQWLLRELGAGPGTVLQLGEPKRIIARRLGMSPESLSRAIAALEEAGAIHVEGRAITVVGRRALEMAAGGMTNTRG
ncbi:cyclic nucleotide-binding domain-containing protein [Elioraea sp. Yellowstone]|jgi:CRP-like cAMP-binding protein|uniref:helix-turn-helix domain-containing protein n=1 Tax=Elioraea sp. Yellowstone TaxID=2592070 RepID=UPI00114EB1E3|nr:helix-turn-helix domain-containing protein [Elioraea sp. Yellowstone]TQF85695.1 cyclic nucleotide-binding domain-containing protein [Elioraea sp. Yellowstone]